MESTGFMIALHCLTLVSSKNSGKRVIPSKSQLWTVTVAWPHDQDICPDTLYLDARGEKVAAVSGQEYP